VQAANHSEAGEGAQFEIFGIGTFPLLAEPANPKRGNSFRPNQDSAVPAAPRVNIPVSTGADSRLEGSIASRFVQTQPTSPLVPGVLTAILLASCGLIILRTRRMRGPFGARGDWTRVRQTYARAAARFLRR
jgi:hypothetical protein